MKTFVCPDPTKFHRWYEQKGLMKYTSETFHDVKKKIKTTAGVKQKCEGHVINIVLEPWYKKKTPDIK